MSLLLAGAILGEVQLSLFVAGAGEIWNDSRSGKSFSFNTKCSWRARKVTSVALRIADWAHGRIMLGSFSDHVRLGRAL